MGSASVSSNNMLLLLGFLELPKNPVVAAGVARGARRWCGAGAVALRRWAALRDVLGFFARWSLGSFLCERPYRGLCLASGEFWHGWDSRREPSKNVRDLMSSLIDDQKVPCRGERIAYISRYSAGAYN